MLDLIFGDTDSLLKQEGQDWYDQTVKEEIGEHAHGNCRHDEESVGSPFQASGSIVEVLAKLEGVEKLLEGRHRCEWSELLELITMESGAVVLGDFLVFSFEAYGPMTSSLS